MKKKKKKISKKKVVKKVKKLKKPKKVKKVKKSRLKSRSGKAKVKKLTYAEKKAENLDKLSHELIEKGRKRGFITYDEILKNFPDIENNILFLDELYEKFSEASIDVLEGGNLLNLDIDLTDKDLNKGSMHDSIQMYLKEIGQYPLIHASAETRVCRPTPHGTGRPGWRVARANLRL